MYAVGGHGGFTDFSGSAMSGQFYQTAVKYCSNRDLAVLVTHRSAQDSGLGTAASAEIQFSCAATNDPRIASQAIQNPS